MHRKRHGPDYYYEQRALDVLLLDGIDRAARFVYLNRTCYNGLYRVNSAGRFNVPIGRYRDPLAQVSTLVEAASAVLKGVALEVRPFEQVLDVSRRGDFVYFDPPYQPISKTASFTSYSKDDFGEDDQRHLADVFHRLTERGVRAMLSNSDHPLVRELYDRPGLRMLPIVAKRAINSNARRRGGVGELLVINYDPTDQGDLP